MYDSQLSNTLFTLVQYTQKCLKVSTRDIDKDNGYIIDMT